MAVDLREYPGVVRVTDGAWGTQLQARGLSVGTCPEEWNVRNPEAVEAVARSYVQAGSDVILTNTFGANRFILAGHCLGERAGELCRAGVAISRRAADDQTKVFASIGPTGKIVMMEEVSAEDLKAAFVEAAEAAEAGRADAVILETFNELAELEIALRAVKEAAGLPVIASMTFSSGADKMHTMMGDSPADLVRLAGECDADGVGANCGVGPDNYVKVADLLRSATDLPIWIKPNAGLPQVGPDGETVFPMGPEEFASFVPKLIDAGANFIGGCCGTTPDHVRALRAAVDGRS